MEAARKILPFMDRCRLTSKVKRMKQALDPYVVAMSPSELEVWFSIQKNAK